MYSLKNLTRNLGKNNMHQEWISKKVHIVLLSLNMLLQTLCEWVLEGRKSIYERDKIFRAIQSEWNRLLFTTLCYDLFKQVMWTDQHRWTWRKKSWKGFSSSCLNGKFILDIWFFFFLYYIHAFVLFTMLTRFFFNKGKIRTYKEETPKHSTTQLRCVVDVLSLKC